MKTATSTAYLLNVHTSFYRTKWRGILGANTRVLPERWSTCGLPHKQYVHVIYGVVIHVQVLWDSYILGNWSILLDGYIEGVCCQDVSSDLGGNMPCTVIFASGSIPMGYACDSIILLYLLPWVFCSVRRSHHLLRRPP